LISQRRFLVMAVLIDTAAHFTIHIPA
jgi:hypothetical protein